MNLRALTRGDAAVAGAAVLLLISSFLPYRSFTLCLGLKNNCVSNSSSAWTMGLFPILPSVFLLGLAGAALILLQRFQGESAGTRQVLGLRLDQWGIALSVAALWTSLWSLAGGGDNVSNGFGAWLGLLSLLVLAGAAAAGPLVPALQAPLLSDKPAVPQGQAYAGAPVGGYQAPGATQPGQPGQPGQYEYGYPGGPLGQGQGQAQGQAQGQGGAQQAPLYGGQPQPGGYGYPTPGQPHDQFQQQAPAPTPTPAPAPTPTPAPAPAAPVVEFSPFWFAVPVPRQLTPKDNPVGPPVGELVPGTWYLAVEQRGSALVAQLQDGTHGLLSDTSGIQRG